MMEFMRPMFGDMAGRAIENQKAKLKFTKGELSYDQYVKVVDSIRGLCAQMAGGPIADRIKRKNVHGQI